MSFGENKNTSVIVKADNYKRGFIAEGDSRSPANPIKYITYIIYPFKRNVNFFKKGFLCEQEKP